MTAPVTMVWRTWRLAPGRHLAGALLSWVSALVPGVQVVLTAAVVDAAASLLEGSRSTDELVPAVGLPLIGLLVAQLVGRVLMALSQYLLTRAGLDVRQQLAEQTMTAGLAMSQPDFENPEQYNRAKRALQEVQSDRVSSLPGDAIELVAAVVSIASVAAALFAWMPVAAVLILLSPVPGAYAAAVYGRKRWALDYEQAEDRRFAAYLQALTLSDHSHKEIAHYRVGALLRGRFTTTLSTLLRADVKTLRANHVAVTIGDALGILLTCAALALVVLSVAADPGSTTLGMLTGFVQGMNSLYGITLTALAGIAAVYQSSLYADNVFSYLDDAPEYPDRSNVVPALAAAPTVGLSDVRFAYPGTDRIVLNGVDLEFPAGLFTVVVGQNGSGKSTLLKLISALYSPTEGRIEFDGRPLDSFDLSELRASIGVVYQDYVKYELSAYDNVAFGRVEQYGDEAAVLGALDTVDMGGRIGGLSRGLETRLGRRFSDAEQLSTGQWQRLAFARAFRADPRVLLADEPSASLDAAGEHAVLQAVLKRRGRTTTVMVSHSLAAIHAADLVVFVEEDGGVRGPGSHESLRELSDEYGELYAQLRENADSGALSEQ